MGGRSLRYTAEAVYGSSCMSFERSQEHLAVEKEVRWPVFNVNFVNGCSTSLPAVLSCSLLSSNFPSPPQRFTKPWRKGFWVPLL